MNLSESYKKRLRELAGVTGIVPPIIPNTMNFWHGGNLNDYNDVIAQKTGRYEFGPGLYITTHLGTAEKYAKGSRKLYLITVEKGHDINEALISEENVKQFTVLYIISSKKKEFWDRLQKYIKDGMVRARNFNVIILNEKAIKPANTKFLRNFYIDNGIDYEMVDNTFGWGEKMMVLYNMKKIVNIIQVKPEDRSSIQDLPINFN